MKSTRIIASCAIALVSAGCTADVADEDANLSNVSDPILGDRILVGDTCDGVVASNTSLSYEDLINSALDYHIARASSPEFEECLADSIPIDHRGRMVEWIAERSLTTRDIRIKCVDDDQTECGGSTGGWAGCAGPITGDEEMMLAYELLDGGNVAQVAGVIAHELMHNYDLPHPHAVGHSVPDVVGACIDEQRIQGVGRSAHSDFVRLAHVGKWGREAYEGSCNRDYAAVGLQGKTFKGRLTDVGLTCGRETFGSIDQTTNVGGQGSSGISPFFQTSFSRNCPTGSVVTGVWGKSNEWTSLTVGPVCSPIFSVRGSSPPSQNFGLTAGSAKGSAPIYTRLCPAGKVVTGYRVAPDELDQYVQRIEVVCDEFHALSRPGQTPLPGAGTASGEAFERRCEGNAVMTGVFGRADDNYHWLRTIGGICTPFGGKTSLARTNVSGDDHRTPTAGEDLDWDVPGAWPNYATACDDGEVMVGAAIRSDADVRGISTLCADYEDWDATGSYDVAPGGVIYASGTNQPYLCPQGEVVVAFTGYEADANASHIRQLALRCSRPEPALEVLETTATIGGSGGSAFRPVRCSGGGPLTGLRVRTRSNSAVVAVGSECGAVYGNVSVPQRAYANPIWFGGASTSTSTDRTLRCSDGKILVGLHGRENSLVQALGTMCKTPSDVKAGSGSTSFGPTWGNGKWSVGSFFQRACPSGQAVLGIRGRTGTAVDQLSLDCGTPDLVPGDVLSGTLDGTGDDRTFRIGLAEDQTDLTVTIIGIGSGSSADFDLYMRRGSDATGSFTDWSSTGSAAFEQITLSGVIQHDFYNVLVRSNGGAGDFAIFVN
jgi:hypothetical protein